MSASPVQGGVGSGDADQGAPVKVGGRYNATKPTLSDGQRGDAQLTSRAAVEVAHAPQDSTWQVLQLQSANTQATATQAAAGAGLKNVCTSVMAALVAGSTAPTVPASPVSVIIRDGASGSGTALWRGYLAIPATAGAADRVLISGLQIVGSANTAMTIEFSGAGGAGTVESVCATGYVL